MNILRVNKYKPIIFAVVKRRLSVTEIKIPVPWGHIAGKHWKINDSPTTPIKPVLCVHGWKDNAGSFDHLMISLSETPLAKHSYEFVCIDLPGHGLSSHYFPGMVYSFYDSLHWFFRVIRHFGWEKDGKAQVTLMGHSLGGMLGFFFASTQNHLIDNFIGLDAVTPVVFTHTDMIQMSTLITEHILAMEDKLKNGPVPFYSKEEALKKMLGVHMMAFDEQTCRTLMQRGVVEDPEGSGRFRFTHDIRVQYLAILPVSTRQVSYLAQSFRSGFLYIKAEKGVHYESNYVQLHLAKWIKKHNSKKFTEVLVENAPHHLHMTHSNIVAQHISDFLLK